VRVREEPAADNVNFTMYAEEYARIAAAEESHWWYRNTRALVAGLLDPWLDDAGRVGSPRRLLDAGCGPGGNGAWLAGYGTLAGVDLRPEALYFARRRHPEVLTAQADVTRLPFPDRCFDVALAVTVLYAVPDDAAALGEIRRVLDTGGVALFVEPAFPALRRAHDRVVGGLRRYRRSGLVALARSVGFEVRRATYAYSFLAPMAGVLAAADRVTRPGSGGAGARSDLERPSLDRVFAKAGEAERQRLVRGRTVPFGTSVVVVGVRDS
jgi:SAM-dependent methyltransferase